MPKRLQDLDIDLSQPGFYDSPAFIAAEKLEPRLLEAYAQHVESLSLDSAYLKHARECTQVTANFFIERLQKDPRRGACVDVSLVLGRFLERQGIWNYAVQGAVAISFPKKSRLATYYMRSHAGVPGHVWLRVPPYRIVDLTISLQDYKNGEEQHLPSSILAENPLGASPMVSDLIDQDAHSLFRHQTGREPRLDEISDYATTTWNHKHAGVQLRYTPCSVTALDGDLEHARNLELSGSYPAQLWKTFQSQLHTKQHQPPNPT